jgi:hypothetical protein
MSEAKSEMKKPDYMSWENFCSTIIVPGEQRSYKVSTSPRIDLFWDGVAKRMGLWLETASNTVVPSELLKLSFISSSIVAVGSREVLEIATVSKPLRRQFYHFAVAVSERMISDSMSAIDAVDSELQCFTDLLAERTLLGVERQIGLLGELLFLEKLALTHGTRMLDSWGGPHGEPHDFRVEDREFEVKTTVAHKRVHIIHGSEQLVPSKGCSLFLLSILLGPPGSTTGFSLAGKVRDLQRLFAADKGRLDRFIDALEKVGLREADLPHYSRQHALRRALAVVPVDEKFPALTRPVVQQSLGTLALRIESLQYGVNLEGLEKEEGTAQFSAIFPTQP